MDKVYIFTVFVILSTYSIDAQNGIELQIDEFIQEVMSCEDIPGLTLTVIKDGEDYLNKGYGLANIKTGEPVTNETMFIINSVTKAFTGMSIAIAKKKNDSFDWTTPVRDILGDWFYMNDSTRTQQLTLVDALSHRSGLAYHNEMRIAGYSPREFIEKLQYLEFSSDFRHQFQYNNLMYSIPGIAIEEVFGQTWMEFVRENIFQPLGMDNSGFIFDDGRLSEVAQGYRADPAAGGQLREADPILLQAYYESVPASGAIITNSLDMRHWIKFQLNQGTTEDGVEILTPLEFQETHIQHNHESGQPTFQRPTYPVTYAPPSGYSLGWSETTYRDYMIQQHLGGIVSFNSILVILPDVNHGIFVSMNKIDTGEVRPVIAMFIMDLLLGEEPWLTKDTVCDLLQPDKSEVQNSINEKRSLNRFLGHQRANTFTPKKKIDQTKNDTINKVDQHPNTNKNEELPVKPQDVLPDFLGVYGHYAYGNITIVEGSSTHYAMLFGRNNWTYDLVPSDENENCFMATGREPIWYHLYDVLFDKNPGEIANGVTVYFDDEKPPKFERDLDWNNPPSPPELCD